MKWKNGIRWIARGIYILGIIFISSFALDAIGPGESIRSGLIGLGIHLIPTIILVALLAIAWKYERAGGILLLVISCAPFFLLGNPFVVNLSLSGPFILAGIMFIVSSLMKNEMLVPEVR